MAIAKRNQTSGNAAGNTASQVTTVPFTPLAGNVLLMWVGLNCANTTARTVDTTVPGGSAWTKLGQTQGSSSTFGGMLACFWKISDGNEGTNPPTITVAGATALPRWVITEYPGNSGGGLDTIDTGIAPTIVLPFLTYTRALVSGADSCPTIAIPAATSLVSSAMGGRGGNTQTVTSWGGGASADVNTSSGVAGFCLTAVQVVTGSPGDSVTHTATYTNSQGGPSEVLGSVAFSVGSTRAPRMRSVLQAVARSAGW